MSNTGNFYHMCNPMSVHDRWAKWESNLLKYLNSNLNMHPVTHRLKLGQGLSVFVNWRDVSSFLIGNFNLFLSILSG